MHGIFHIHTVLAQTHNGDVMAAGAQGNRRIVLGQRIEDDMAQELLVLLHTGFG